MEIKLDKDIIFRYKEKTRFFEIDNYILHYIIMFRKFDDRVIIHHELTTIYNYTENGLNAIEITNKTLLYLLQSSSELLGDAKKVRLQLFLNLYKNYTNK